MSDPAKTTPAEIRYEIRVKSGPCKLKVAGETFERIIGQDIVVLVCMVTSNRMIMSEQIVGVIGDEWRSGTVEFLRIRDFLMCGGVIGLNRDIS